jgi:polysaccharide chain length determinant protein (PEP-CTERM system associated)
MANSSESVLQTHLGAVRRRWPAGLVAAALVLAVLVPVAIGLPNLYRSSVTLIVDQAPSPLNDNAAGESLEVSARLLSIRQEVLTRQNTLAMAEELNLYPELRQAGAFDSVLAMMQRDVHVEPIRGSRGDGRVTTVSFRVSYTGDDPVKVATTANRLSEFYVRRSGAMRSEQQSRTVDTLRREVDAAQRSLEAQEQRLTQFTTQNAGALPAQMTSISTRYSQLTTQMSANTSEISRLLDRRDGLETEISALATPTAAADVTDPAIRLEQAKRELETLLGRFKEPSFEVRSKRSEIANLERQVAARGRAGSTGPDTSQLATLRGQVADLTRRIEGLQATNRALQEDMDKYDGIIERAPVRSAQFERLTSDLAQLRTNYNALTTRYQEALAGGRAQTGQGGQEFQVIDPAVPAEEPSAPNRRILLGLALVAALVLGVGVMLLLDRMDRSFKSVDELRAFTHVPVLGTIPRIVTRKAKTRRVVWSAVTAVGVSVVLGFVSVGVLHYARSAEIITRMLLR